MTLPEGNSVSLVQDLRSRRGATDGTKTVWGGRTKIGDGEGFDARFAVEGVGVTDSEDSWLKGRVVGVGVTRTEGSGLDRPE